MRSMKSFMKIGYAACLFVGLLCTSGAEAKSVKLQTTMTKETDE